MFCSSIGWCLVWIMPFSLIDSMTNQIGASFLRKHRDSVELFKWFLHFHLAKSNLLPEDNNPSCERVILSWCKDCILQIMEVINRNMSSFSFSAARSVVACISHPGFLVLSRAWCGYVWQYLVKCNSFLKILGDRPENKGFDIPIVTSVLGDNILLNKFMAMFLRELNAFHNT